MRQAVVVAAAALAAAILFHPRVVVAHAPEITEPAVDDVPEPVAEPAGEEGESPRDPETLRAEEAERHFIEGKALFAERKYTEAAAEFRRSYTAFPTPNALYNIGLASERAGDAIAAIRSYSEYLSLENLPPDRISEVRRVVGELRSHVAEIAVVIPNGVAVREIRIDERVIPLADFPILVVPGELTVEVFGTGANQRRERTYEVDGGQRLQIEIYPFKTRRPPAQDPAADPPTEPTAPGHRSVSERRIQLTRRFFWASLAMTAAGGVTVAVLGGLAKRAETDFNESKCPKICTLADAERFPFPTQKKVRAVRLQTATNITIGVTTGLGVTAVILGVVSFGRRTPGRAATRRVMPAPGGISFSFSL